MDADGRPDRTRPAQGDGDTQAHAHRHHLPHPHLIDADEDRWKWRARIRRDPRKLFFYRIGVALVGVLLMVSAMFTGPLPGPGGIPLFLLGLAVWSSEFEWAQDVMLWIKAQFKVYRRLSRQRKTAFWIGVAVVACAALYLALMVYGVPGWVPDAVRSQLERLPGAG